ncbi:N-acetylmuramoyl-L-alanine amidase AmiA precursor [bacterium BMS3Abin03]|nr:N-acetylmuramoyl-L-alanine amidase AmiA precursor [bacterium BMS3Abin03]
MNFKFLYILFFLLFANATAQNFDMVYIQSGGTVKPIPAYTREGILYFSIRDFAEALNINYFFNEKNGKFELKFNNYLLKVTSKNPYLVITERVSGSQWIFQLPTSSYYLKQLIFVPLKYIIGPVAKAYGREIIFAQPNKLIIGGKIIGDKQWFTHSTEYKKTGAFDVTGIMISEKANGTLIKIQTSKRIPSYYSSFKDGILTLIFRKVNADVSRINRDHLNGLIKKIETKNIGPDTEFKIVVGKGYSTYEVMNVEGSNDIIVTIHNKIFTNFENELKTQKKWGFDVIVIDPGHGGKDPGAIGIGKVKEKDINLSVALKLGKLIEKNMKDVKVVYTRKTDKFVDLYKRGKIANEKDGKLFISIHCNSTKKKPTDVNGIEVYLLRPGRTSEAITIAERENSVIEYEDDPARYKKLTDENFILVSMAHSAYMKYSETFADLLNNEFKHNTKLKARGVKQAGFYVLVGASMPNVLIETGFISNKKDAIFLKSHNGQKQLAEAIFDAIKSYRKFYEKEMEAEL